MSTIQEIQHDYCLQKGLILIPFHRDYSSYRKQGLSPIAERLWSDRPCLIIFLLISILLLFLKVWPACTNKHFNGKEK